MEIGRLLKRIGPSDDSVSYRFSSFQVEDVKLEINEEPTKKAVDDESADASTTKNGSASSSKSSTPLRDPPHPKSLVPLAVMTLKLPSEEETSEVTVNGQLRKDGGLVIVLADKKSGKSETLTIEVEA